MDDRQVVQRSWRATVWALRIVLAGVVGICGSLLFDGNADRGLVLLFLGGFVVFAFVLFGIAKGISNVILARISHDERRAQRSRRDGSAR